MFGLKEASLRESSYRAPCGSEIVTFTAPRVDSAAFRRQPGRRMGSIGRLATAALFGFGARILAI